jgi:hypothetical protein
MSARAGVRVTPGCRAAATYSATSQCGASLSSHPALESAKTESHLNLYSINVCAIFVQVFNLFKKVGLWKKDDLRARFLIGTVRSLPLLFQKCGSELGSRLCDTMRSPVQEVNEARN